MTRSPSSKQARRQPRGVIHNDLLSVVDWVRKNCHPAFRSDVLPYQRKLTAALERGDLTLTYTPSRRSIPVMDTTELEARREALLKRYQSQADEARRNPDRGVVELDGAWAEAFGQWPIDLVALLSEPKPTPSPTAAMRDCVSCELPFFSRSAANVVSLVCRENTDFDGGM